MKISKSYFLLSVLHLPTTFHTPKYEMQWVRGVSTDCLWFLFCRSKVMSEMSEPRQRCTHAACLAGVIPLGQPSYLLAAPALPVSGSDAAVCSQRWGWNSQPAEEHPICLRKRQIYRVQTDGWLKVSSRRLIRAAWYF